MTARVYAPLSAAGPQISAALPDSRSCPGRARLFCGGCERPFCQERCDLDDVTEHGGSGWTYAGTRAREQQWPRELSLDDDRVHLVAYRVQRIVHGYERR